jgi:hemolysin activation/secretion protein
LISSRSLPANADVTYRTFGAEAIMQDLNYKLNPRKGYKIIFNAGISFRNFLKNSTVENTYDPVEGKPFSYLYDTVKLKSYKYNISGSIANYYPFSKRMVMATILSGGITFSSNPLYRNELYQIGGYRLLRGFDEGSLFVNNYEVLTLEPRYLLSTNSYFFLFTDLAYIQSKFAQTFIKDTPYSFGLGMSFETKAGFIQY